MRAPVYGMGLHRNVPNVPNMPKDIEMIEKISGQVQNRPAHNQKPAQQVDLRTDTTAWEALVWAYRAECVRAVGGDSGPGRWISPSYSVFLAGETSGGGRGAINGHLDCHIDALVIDGLVKATLGGEALHQVMKAAGDGMLPKWQLEFEPLRCGPVLRQRKGIWRPHVVYKAHSRMPDYCPLEWTGVPREQRVKAQQQQMEVWFAFVTLLRDLMRKSDAGVIRLEKWRITGLGVDVEPWANNEA